MAPMERIDCKMVVMITCKLARNLNQPRIAYYQLMITVKALNFAWDLFREFRV